LKQEAMKKVFKMDQMESDMIPSSGHNRYWLIPMDFLDNLGIIILVDYKGVEFPAPAHPEEELIWVLEGQLSYKHGPVVNPGEAILIIPNVPHPGKYIGKMLVFWCNPFTHTGLKPDTMNRVINSNKINQNRILKNPSGSVVKALAVTNNMSICIIEAQPGARFDDKTGHPQKEIVYVLKGQIEYDDGRVVRANEAVCNLPHIPHPGGYAGKGQIQFLEVKSPPDSRFSKILGISPGL